MSRPIHACPRGRGAKLPSHRLNPSLAGGLGVLGFSSKSSASFITDLKKKIKRETNTDKHIKTQEWRPLEKAGSKQI